jgi:phage baseplate assembly protein W
MNHYYLRQSTASQEVIIGPFLDSLDVSAETGLTIANTDIKIYKAGTTTSANKNSGGATHDAAGRYSMVLDATDTNTLGSGRIDVAMSGALPCSIGFTVLAANVYDSLIGGGDLLDVSTTQFNGTAVTASAGRPEVNTTHWAGTAVASAVVSANVTQISGDSAAADALESYCDGTTPQPVNATQISGDSAAADELERWMDGTAGTIGELGIVDRGTAQSATSTTLVLRSAVGFADDSLIGATIFQNGGTNSPQMARVTDYVGSTDTATVAAWPNGTPAGTITYVVFGTTADSAGGGLDAAGVRAALGMASADLDTQLDAIKSDTAATLTDTAVIGAPVGASISADIAAVKAQTAAIEADTQDLQTQVGTDGAGLTALPWNAAWDAEVQSECTDALNAYDPPTNAELTARTLATADYATATALATTDSVADDIYARLGAPAGASVSADIAAVKSDTAATLVDTAVIGAAGAGLTAIPWNPAWDTEVQSECADALAAYDPPTNAEMAARTLATADYATAANLATVAGYLDTEIAAILEDTGTTLPGLLSAISDAIAALPDDVLTASNGVETGFTLQQALRIILSATVGKTSSGGTVFRDVGDTKNRISATVESGNRTAVTLDAS